METEIKLLSAAFDVVNGPRAICPYCGERRLVSSMRHHLQRRDDDDSETCATKVWEAEAAARVDEEADRIDEAYERLREGMRRP